MVVNNGNLSHEIESEKNQPTKTSPICVYLPQEFDNKY